MIISIKRDIIINVPFFFPLQEVPAMWRKLLVAFLFVLFVSSQAHSAEQRYSIPIDNCPILGPANAQITIVEFLDFQ
jgi:hypothetical protein